MAASIGKLFGERTTNCIQSFFRTLSKKDQRRNAAIEVRQLGHGAITYVAGILGCSIRTILRGMDELDVLEDDPAAGRVRRPGSGRKKRITPDSEIEQNLQSLTETRSAGNPEDPQNVFTDLTPTRLEQELESIDVRGLRR